MTVGERTYIWSRLLTLTTVRGENMGLVTLVDFDESWGENMGLVTLVDFDGLTLMTVGERTWVWSCLWTLMTGRGENMSLAMLVEFDVR